MTDSRCSATTKSLAVRSRIDGLCRRPQQAPPVGWRIVAGRRWGVERWRQAGLFLLSSLWLLTGIPSASAAENAVPRVEFGPAGLVKVGVWSEARVDVGALTAADGTVQVSAADPTGQIANFFSRVTNDDIDAREVVVPFLVGRLQSPVTVEWRQGEQLVATRVFRPTADSSQEQTFQLRRQDVRLVVQVGSVEEFPLEQDELATSRELVIVRYGSPRELPRTADGMSAIDVLVVSRFDDWDESRTRLVHDWTAEGGELILIQSPDAPVPADIPLTASLPLKAGEAESLRDFSSLESYAGQAARIPFRGSVSVSPWQLTTGIREAAARELTLVGRTMYGFGRLTLCSLPLDRPPLSRWEARGAFCRRLIDVEPRGIDVGGSQSGSRQLGHVGVSDLASQLHAAIDQFPQVHRPSIQMTLLLLFVFVLICGPLDYLLVHKLLKRPHATWLTLPLMLVAVSAGAIWMGRSGNGEDLLSRRTTMLDFDSVSGRVRLNSWGTIYSPSTARFDIRQSAPDWLRPADPQRTDEGVETHRESMAWSGVPENIFGGMYREPGIEFATNDYRIDHAPATITGLPITVWSTRLFHHRFDAVSRELVTSRLTSSASGRLAGTFEHRFPGELTDWMLAFGNRLYRPTAEMEEHGLGGIPPNFPTSPSERGIYQREMRGYLTRMRALSSVGKEQRRGDIVLDQEQYDSASTDLNMLWRMITFHEAAGGESYTGLKNVPLSALEMSDALNMGMAVLFARLDAPICDLTINGNVAASEDATFVRVILPVTAAAETMRELPKFSDDDD